MKRFILFSAALMLVAMLGCDKTQNPTSPQIAQPSEEVDLREALADSAREQADPNAKSANENQITAAPIRVPDDYATIQAAVDAASPGTKIIVKASGSPYNETVTVNQADIHLTAKGSVTLNGSFTVWGNNVSIQHFHINAATSGEGVRVNYASGVKIRQNTITDGSRGIEIFSGTGCFLEKNTITGAQANGIFLAYSNDNIIARNACTGNSQGMNMVFSDDNHVLGNNFSDNTSRGMEVSNDSDQNKFAKNVCNRNGQDGIFHYSSSNNTFGPGNTANFNEYGIRFDGTNITVIKNDFHCNTLGDILDAGTGSTVINNSTGPLPECM